MVALLLLVLLHGFLVYGKQQGCKLVRFVGVLDCVNVGLQNVPIIQKDRDAVKVLDLRQNNITKLDSKIMAAYPNLKLIDVRENPRICGGVFVSVTVKSDCKMNKSYLPSSYTLSPSTILTRTIQTTLRQSPTKPFNPTVPSPPKTSANPSTHIPPNPYTLTIHNTQSQNTPQPSKFRSSSFSLPSPSSL
jgi:hypothetical protein